MSDGEGEPVAAAIVRAWQETYTDGQRAMRVVGTVSTDDLGNYRLFSWLREVLRERGTSRQNDHGTLCFIPTPRTSDPGLVTLYAGSVAAAINITYRSEPAARFVEPSVPTRDASLQLTPRIPIVNEDALVSVDSRTGTFSITEILRRLHPHGNFR